MRYLFILIFLFSCQYKAIDSDKNSIKENISLLASDEYAGRGTGSEGEKLAAELIIKNFKTAGLKPFKKEFLVPFEYNGEIELAEAKLSIHEKEYKLFNEFAVYPFSANINSEKLSAIYVKYGIKSEAENYNDYRRLNVRGKVVVALEGYPEHGKAHSDLAYKSRVREKARIARDMGAKALILLTDKINKGLKNKHVNTDAGIPVLSLSKELLVKSKLSRGKVISKNISITVKMNRIQKKPNNIIAVKEGKIKDQYIVVGAHYDHLGLGYQSGAYPGNSGQIHNGADDNASGTSSLVELAKVLKNYEPQYSILFMAFSGEELGLLGSKAILADKHIEPEKIRLMINLDMVGRLNESSREVTIYGTKTALEFDTVLSQVNKNYQFKLKRVEYSPGNSDHAAFYAEKIPVLFFNTDLHGDYHKPSDDVDKINIQGIAELSNFIRDLYFKLDNFDQKVTYQLVKEPNKRSVRAFSVYIGTLPNYAYQGKGFKIDGASAGSPAEKAGLKKNDVIVSIKGKKIDNIYDYMGVLGELRAGQKTEFIIKRDNKEISINVTPGSKDK